MFFIKLLFKNRFHAVLLFGLKKISWLKANKQNTFNWASVKHSLEHNFKFQVLFFVSISHYTIDKMQIYEYTVMKANEDVDSSEKAKSVTDGTQ